MAYIAWDWPSFEDIFTPPKFPTATPTPLIHLIDPNIKYEIIPFTSATNTPVPAELVEPTTTPAPSLSPTQTVATSPTTTQSATPSPQVTSTPTNTPTSIPQPSTTVDTTGSATSSNQTVTINSNLFLVVLITFLVLVILKIQWPKIKSWLHTKTA